MPLLISTVNLHTGAVYCFSSKEFRRTISNKIVYVNHANLAKVVRASCSYPVIFSPTIYKNLELVDGGLRENVPWRQIRDLGASRVISVVFEKEFPEDKIHNNILDVLR